MDPRYQNGIIYMLWCGETNRMYIGSTIKTLKERVYKHKINMRSYPRTNYCSSFEILKGGCYTASVLEHCPCNSKKELERREGLYQTANIDRIVNTNIAGRTFKEYYLEKRTVRLNTSSAWRSIHKDYAHDYYMFNKEKISKRTDCECGGHYIHAGKARHLKSKRHLDAIFE